jgi:hypothetical protein
MCESLLNELNGSTLEVKHASLDNNGALAQISVRGDTSILAVSKPMQLTN